MPVGERDHDAPNAVPADVGLLTTIGSVLAAFFGVQSSRARVRDFSRGSPLMFAGVALALTLTFVLMLATTVRLLMAFAGGAS